jgi:hypothetical protein
MHRVAALLCCFYLLLVSMWIDVRQYKPNLIGLHIMFDFTMTTAVTDTVTTKNLMSLFCFTI